METLVSCHQGRVQRCCYPISRIASLKGNLTANHTDAGDTRLRLVLRRRLRRILSVGPPRGKS